MKINIFYSALLLSSNLSSSFLSVFAANVLPPIPNETANAIPTAATIMMNVLSTIAFAIPSWLKQRNASTT